MLLAGTLVFLRSGPSLLETPERVVPGEVPSAPFGAMLVWVTASEERTRQETLEAPPEAGAQLGESLAALRAWLRREGAWPSELGAPRVFLVEAGDAPYAVLDFPLNGAPQLSAAAEGRLLASLQRTAARQGVRDITLLVNGRTAETFLGQVALSDVLDGPLADALGEADEGGQ